MDHTQQPKVLAGRYRIEALIGRGGMSDVYRGTDELLDRPVAIKILTDRSEDIRKRFLREAQSMARLNHPNIVAVHDAAHSDGVSFIVMEIVAGRTLATISPTELTVHTALRYLLDLLEALAFAHENKVIHRDVKPANIMVLPAGTIKVMDFGLSRRTSEMSSVTNAGEIVGTIAYLSPERFLGKPADARSDLYSVGVVMYEVFTGTVPFRNETDDLVAVIFAHVNEPPPPLRTVNPAVPLPIERIVLKLLEKDPERRYQSARDVIDEIKALLGLAPGTAAQPAPTPPPAQRPAPPRAAPRNEAPRPAAAPAPQQQQPQAAHNARDDEARQVLRKTFGSTTQTLNEGYASTLAGMLASRKRDWVEATRAYQTALHAFSEVGNDLEHAKTALKYSTMILAKSSETDHPDRDEVESATELLGRALLTLRNRQLSAELEDGERVLYALQRTGLRIR
jgi:serine/threonine protein kinase